MHRRTERDPRTAFLAGPDPADSTCGRKRPRVPMAIALLAQALALAILLLSSVGVTPAGAAPTRSAAAGANSGFVSVIKVSGLLDRVLVDFVETQLTSAQHDGAVALVLQLNSK